MGGKLRPNDLIPPGWNLEVETEEEIIFLGKSTIAEMIRMWTYHHDTARAYVKRIEKEMGLLGQGIDKLIKIADKYENPEFKNIGFVRVGLKDIYEPLDYASIIRKEGTTTFNVCGWCKYAERLGFRHSYNAVAYCSFLEHGQAEAELHFFNTPCFIKRGSQDEIDFIMASLKFSYKKLVKIKRGQKIIIQYLKHLQSLAVEKPIIPKYRPYDYFKIGEKVICYLEDDIFCGSDGFKDKIVEDYFIEVRIESICEQDITVSSGRHIHVGSYQDGYGFICDSLTPEIMKPEDLEYLISNPDFASAWATLSISEDFQDDRVGEFIKNLKVHTGG